MFSAESSCENASCLSILELFALSSAYPTGVSLIDCQCLPKRVSSSSYCRMNNPILERKNGVRELSQQVSRNFLGRFYEAMAKKRRGKYFVQELIRDSRLIEPYFNRLSV